MTGVFRLQTSRPPSSAALRPRVHRPHGLFVIVVVLAASAPVCQGQQVRFLQFAEVSNTIELFRESGVPGSDIKTAAAWNAWIRQEDKRTRARVNRGIEDSISNLILYGTSYTNLPRLDGSDQAVDGSGDLVPPVRARIRALLKAIPSTQSERMRVVGEFLAKKNLTTYGEQADFLSRNLKRFVQEQRAYAAKLAATDNPQDVSKLLGARGTLYSTRGLSIDTSLLPNYGLEATLRALLAKGVLKPGSIQRIAIIGPGLDFTDKREGYDFYPLQTTQPFAVMEATIKLGLGAAKDIQVVTMDLNPLVNSHVASLAANAREHKAYTIQLPHNTEADWSTPAVDYWKHFGDTIGQAVEPLPIPAELRKTLDVRAVSIPPDIASRIHAVDLDVVAQTVDATPPFDLVVATNILVYYDLFEQALAMNSIARMMRPGGVFIANDVLPSLHTHQLLYLGRKTVPYAADGSYGDDFVVYERQ